MSPWLVYDDTTCPVCGNTEGNRDHGPYEPHPLDDALGGTPDPRIHLMTCGRCGKCFDAGPAEQEDGEGEWFHRGPCHRCASCGGTGCYVWNDGVSPEVHVCEGGCDGMPPGLERAS